MRSGNESGKFRLIKDVCNCLETVSWRCLLRNTIYCNGNYPFDTVLKSDPENRASVDNNLHRMSPSTEMCCNQWRTGSRFTRMLMNYSRVLSQLVHSPGRPEHGNLSPHQYRAPDHVCVLEDGHWMSPSCQTGIFPPKVETSFGAYATNCMLKITPRVKQAVAGAIWDLDLCRPELLVRLSIS